MVRSRPSSLAAASLLLLLAAGAGCAAKFVPSEQMRSLQKGMDPAEAANVVARLVERTAAQTGLCKAPFGFDDPKPVASLDALTLQAWRAGEEVGRKKEGDRTVISYKKERYEETRRFGELTKIRVTRDARGMCAGPVRAGLVAVTLHDGRVAVPLVVAVAPGDLDNLLAALSVLAPKAPIVEGAGL